MLCKLEAEKPRGGASCSHKKRPVRPFCKPEGFSFCRSAPFAQIRRSPEAFLTRQVCRSLPQPLSVRKKGSGFELVAGERRLRAAGLAGLREVPCLLVSADDQDAGLLALVENLQRRDLDYIEQAQGLARLMQQYHLTQEQAARRVGKSQSAIANKLRLLKLSEPVLALLRASGLSERHARALLRIEDEAAQLRLVRLIAENGWTVAKTERYIDELCAKSSQKAKLGHFVLRDMRVFFNTINHQLDLIRAAGVDAGTEQRETEHEIVLTIRIPKSACVR